MSFLMYFNALRQPYLKTLYLVWVWPRGMPLSFLIFSRLRQLLSLFSQLQVGLDPRPRQNARLSENPKEVLFWTIGTTLLVLVGCVCVCLGAVCFFFLLPLHFFLLSESPFMFVCSFIQQRCTGALLCSGLSDRGCRDESDRDASRRRFSLAGTESCPHRSLLMS